MKRKEFFKKAILGMGVLALFPVSAGSRLDPKLYYYFTAKTFDYGNELYIILTTLDGRGKMHSTFSGFLSINPSDDELNLILKSFHQAVPYLRLHPNCRPPPREGVFRSFYSSRRSCSELFE